MIASVALGESREIAALGAEIFQSLPAWVGLAAVGLVLLLFGRNLYWLLLGAVGFLLGFGLLSQLVTETTSLAPLIAGVAGGLLGLFAAVVVQGALLAVIGAVLGAVGSLVVVSMWGIESPVLLLVVAVVGAVIGAVVLRKLFFASLMVVTALLGAGMLIEAMRQVLLIEIGAGGLPLWVTAWTYPGPEKTLLFAVLVGVGVMFQARNPKKDRHKRAARELKRERRLQERRRKKERRT